jgi:TATA-box binding protein (TBP) (component of TFIID and TFIIIB)
MIGTLNTTIDMDNLINKLELDDIFIGIKYKSKTKGQIIPSKIKKKRFKNNFYNCLTLFIKPKQDSDRILKVKLFCSGAVHIPGCIRIKEGEEIVQLLCNKMKSFNKEDFNRLIGPYDNLLPQIYSEKTMLTTQYELSVKHIDRLKLSSIIREKYNVYCRYNPEKYPGLKIYYIAECHNPEDTRTKITIIMHRSGKVSINGANKKYKIIQAYKFINKIILDNLRDIIYQTTS